MIKDERIKVILNSRHISYFNSFGYLGIKPNQELEVFTNQLPKSSNLKIDVVCDFCGKLSNQRFQDYVKYTNNLQEKYNCHDCCRDKVEKTCIIRYGCSSPLDSDNIRDKIKLTTLLKYGFSHYSKTDEYKGKYRNTCMKRYGVENSSHSVEFMEKAKKSSRETNESSGSWIPLSKKSDFELYKRKARSLTRKNIKNLDWDGYDFYDGEYIKDNFSYHWSNDKYPTIDHKISIYEGFMKGLSVEEVSNISNLCWTKRIINSKKNRY